MALGHVYILTNPCLPGLIKIGATRGPAESRALELSRCTSIPEPFEVFAAFEAQDPFALESMVHAHLAEYRHRRRKEFFCIPPPVAKRRIAEIRRGKKSRRRVQKTSEVEPLEGADDIGRAIRARRVMLNMTQMELAKKAGVGRRAILEIENGKRTAQVGLVLAACSAVGLPICVPAFVPFPQDEPFGFVSSARKKKSKSVAELKTVAKAMGIKGAYRMKKAELMAAVGLDDAV